MKEVEYMSTEKYYRIKPLVWARVSKESWETTNSCYQLLCRRNSVLWDLWYMDVHVAEGVSTDAAFLIATQHHYQRLIDDLLKEVSYGTIAAERMRAACNNLTNSERKESLKTGLKIINGTKPKKKKV